MSAKDLGELFFTLRCFLRTLLPTFTTDRDLSLALGSSMSRNIRHFLRVGFFYLSSPESYFLKYKKSMRQGGSISRNIRNFLILEQESSISGNIRNFFEADVLILSRLG